MCISPRRPNGGVQQTLIFQRESKEQRRIPTRQVSQLRTLHTQPFHCHQERRRNITRQVVSVYPGLLLFDFAVPTHCQLQIDRSRFIARQRQRESSIPSRKNHRNLHPLTNGTAQNRGQRRLGGLSSAANSHNTASQRKNGGFDRCFHNHTIFKKKTDPSPPS